MNGKAVSVTLMLSVCIVLMLPTLTADAVLMTDEFRDKINDDTCGMLFGGINVIKVYPSAGEYTEVTFPIYYFNTMDKSVTYDLKIHQYREEREHTVKKNYTYYFLPDLSWVNIDEPTCVIPPDHYYISNVTVRMPTDEAFTKAGDGGFIFVIDGEAMGSHINLVPTRKIFLTMYHEGYVPSIVGIHPIFYVIGIIITIGVIYIIISKVEVIKRDVPK